MHLRALAGAALLLWAVPAWSDVHAEQAWIREPPPVAAPLAGYVRLANRGGRARTLVAVNGGDVRSVEVHRTVYREGIARMQRLPTLELPAGATVELRPGGAHLMLFGVRAPIVAGASLLLHLEFADGESLPVRFTVVPSAGPAGPAGTGTNKRN